MEEYLKQVINYINNCGELCDNFGSFSKIYSMTTENIYGFLKNYDLKDKRVLTVAGSGDQRLNAYFLGAKSVTCFDVNPLTKFHMELKDKAISSINFEKFINFFSIYSRRYGSYYHGLDYRIFDEFKEKLSNETKTFFEYVINSTDIHVDDIYYYFVNELNILENMNCYLNVSGYEQMGKILQDKEIGFIESDFEDLPDIINGEKYDMILLSNISDYIHRMYGKNELEEYRMMIDRLCNNLNMYGILQVGYIYTTDAATSNSLSFDISRFSIKEDREEFFPSDIFHSVFVDSYYGSNFKDEVITYQKIK